MCGNFRSYILILIKYQIIFCFIRNKTLNTGQFIYILNYNIFIPKMKFTMYNILLEGRHLQKISTVFVWGFLAFLSVGESTIAEVFEFLPFLIF